MRIPITTRPLLLILVVCLMGPLGLLSADELLEAEFKDLRAQFLSELRGGAESRSRTIAALAKLDMPEVTKLLAQHFPKEDKADFPTISAYISALSRRLDEHSVRALLESGFEKLDPMNYGMIDEAITIVKDKDALTWIFRKGWKQIPDLDPKAQQIFVSVMARTNDPRIVTPANKLLNSKGLPEDVTAEFVRILRYKGNKTSAKKIAQLYKISERDMQVECLLALREIEASEYSDIFLKAIKNPYWQVRAVAVDIVGDTHQQQLGEYIFPCLNDPEIPVQVAAVAALKKFGGRTVIEPLIAALETTTGRVQDDIGDALVFLTGEDFGVNHLGWDTWWQSQGPDAEIKGISREEFERIKEEQANATTGVYYGLPILSKYITFIVDVSGSMGEPYNVKETTRDKHKRGGGTGVDDKKKKKEKSKYVRKTKIEVAREELIKALSNIPNGTKFNIIKFSGSYSAWQPALATMNERIREEAIAFARNLGSGGTTNVFDTLSSAMDDPDVNTIYFLSDGAPTAGKYQDTPTILQEIDRMNQSRKCKIHTIGFHLDPVAEELMRALAEKNFGRFVKR